MCFYDEKQLQIPINGDLLQYIIGKKQSRNNSAYHIIRNGDKTDLCKIIRSKREWDLQSVECSARGKFKIRSTSTYLLFLNSVKQRFFTCVKIW